MSLVRCSSDPRACPGVMGEVLSSPVSQEGWREQNGRRPQVVTREETAGEKHRRGGDA